MLGIRNFIVQVTVDISSDEGRLRREKSYVNKLNLVLVQVSRQKIKLIPDPQTSMASRLAFLHPRNRCLVSHQSLPL
jgi:hypothetical protein